MPDFAMLQQLLDMGGNLGILFFGWAVWKLDRRLLVIETAVAAFAAEKAKEAREK